MSPWLGCLKGDFCQTAEQKRKGFKCGIWKQWQHRHQELTWHTEIPVLHSSSNDHNPSHRTLSLAISCLPAVAAGGVSKKRNCPHFTHRETEAQSNGVAHHKSPVGNPERKPQLVTPRPVLYCPCWLLQTGCWTAWNSQAAARKGKVASRNYFHLKLKNWEILGTTKGLRSSIVAKAASRQAISQWNAEAVT